MPKIPVDNDSILSEEVLLTFKRSARESECYGIEYVHKAENWFCKIGVKGMPSETFVFGDSHALSLLPVMDAAFDSINEGGSFVASAGCTPFLGLHALRNRQEVENCNLLNTRVFNFVRDNDIKKVVLIARWSYYSKGGYGGGDFSYISNNASGQKTAEESYTTFSDSLNKTVKEYNSIGVEVFIITQVPEQRITPRKAYKALFSNKIKTIDELSIKTQEHISLQRDINDMFAETNANVCDISMSMCNEEFCKIGSTTESFYYDGDHLSVSGSLQLKENVKMCLEQQLYVNNKL